MWEARSSYTSHKKRKTEKKDNTLKAILRRQVMKYSTMTAVEL
jgi:hypothetical protein